MSGGSQHNPNGRQSQIGAGWSPLQLQVASLLARAPQAHMAMERGHTTWHTPTPQPHLYHPASPDPLQAMKGANVFRHMLDANLATQPDKHLMRHTPSPGDVKSAPVPPPVDLFPHLGSGREKHPLPHPDELLARGVDLSVGSRGAPDLTGRGPPDLTGRGPDTPRGPPDLTGRGISDRRSDLSTRSPDLMGRTGRSPDLSRPPAAHSTGPALSVRDAPTINSLIARSQPRAGATRVDSLLERLGAPVSPHSVIVHARPDPPSPHSSNEDSTDSCGAPSGSKRKRKPERTIRVPLPPNITRTLTPPAPFENGDSHKHNGPEQIHPETHTPAERRTPLQTHTPESHTPPESHTQPESTHTRRKSSSETIDDIAAMIKNPIDLHNEKPAHVIEESTVTIDKLKSVLASDEKESERRDGDKKSPREDEKVESVVAAAAPKRRRTRTSNTESTNVPVESPSEAKPAETSEEPLSEARTTEPAVQTAECTKTNEPVAKSVENTVRSVDNTVGSVDNTVGSVENTVRSVGNTVGSVDNTVRSVGNTVGSVDNTVRSVDNTVGSVDNTVRSVDDTVRSVDDTVRSHDDTDKTVENAPKLGASVDKTADTAVEKPTATFVEVENQLEKMFAGLEEEPKSNPEKPSRGRKRRKSAPSKGEAKAGRRAARAFTGDERRRPGRNKGAKKKTAKDHVREYDSGSNASSSRSRGPYIQIRGPRDSPLSVSVINATTGEDEEAPGPRRKDEFRNGMHVRGLHQSTLGLRYDATTPDATWLCAFCEKGPHANGLGDLFGPYNVDNDCDEYRELDEAARRRYASSTSPGEVWMHEACAVWAPGLLGTGARLWGLSEAVWGARGSRCDRCGRHGAAVACTHRGCAGRTHVPCAAPAQWALDDADFRAFCYRHVPV